MMVHDSTPPASASIGGQVLAIATRVDPGVGGRTYTEGYLAQPIIMARGSLLRGLLSGVFTLDLEGLTMKRGQLTPGAYGEGYVDRRHPHTYLHEAMAIVGGAFRGTRVSLAGGKGFVPFGTDDPMMRPFAAYPVNHHLAQILERYVGAAALTRGPVTLEGAVFNGDEPISPGSPPDAGHFGDSWAARATIVPRRELELQGSFASVTSPELAIGRGLDQRKWSVSGRLERQRGALRYALVEFASTQELFGDTRTNRFTSFLAEGSTSIRGTVVSARFENATRPEEERLLDPFRTSRTPTDLGIIGITRWRIGTVALAYPVRMGGVAVSPFIEGAYARPREEVTPSAFVPRDFYGARAIWSTSLGVRLSAGAMAHRMGRYGAGVPNAARTSERPMHPEH